MEIECAMENILLRDQFFHTMESLKPINLIKDVFTSSEAKTTVVDTAIGMTSGYLAKKAIVRSSKNPILKLLGTIIGVGVANFMSKHPETIKYIGGKILNGVVNSKKNDGEET